MLSGKVNNPAKIKRLLDIYIYIVLYCCSMTYLINLISCGFACFLLFYLCWTHLPKSAAVFVLQNCKWAFDWMIEGSCVLILTTECSWTLLSAWSSVLSIAKFWRQFWIWLLRFFFVLFREIFGTLLGLFMKLTDWIILSYKTKVGTGCRADTNGGNRFFIFFFKYYYYY